MQVSIFLGSFSHSGIPGFPFGVFCSQEQNSRNIFRNIDPFQNIFLFWNTLYQTNAPLELLLGRPVGYAQVQLRSCTKIQYKSRLGESAGLGITEFQFLHTNHLAALLFNQLWVVQFSSLRYQTKAPCYIVWFSLIWFDLQSPLLVELLRPRRAWTKTLLNSCELITLLWATLMENECFHRYASPYSQSSIPSFPCERKGKG